MEPFSRPDVDLLKFRSLVCPLRAAVWVVGPAPGNLPRHSRSGGVFLGEPICSSSIVAMRHFNRWRYGQCAAISLLSLGLWRS